jgi:DNA invertase Pin-like site-specific DNA recombinase
MSNNDIVSRKGPDVTKIDKIKEILAKNPQGLWVREIARKTGLDKSTVSIYLTKYMSNEVEETFPKIKGKLIKVVKLKGIK